MEKKDWQSGKWTTPAFPIWSSGHSLQAYSKSFSSASTWWLDTKMCVNVCLTKGAWKECLGLLEEKINSVT